MIRSREHVHGGGARDGIAQLCKALHVARHGRAVAGDVHDPLRLHRGDALHHVGSQPLSRRVNGDNVRAQMLLCELLCHVGRVAAEEFHVFDAVAHGVFACVVDGLRHDLRAEDSFRVIGERKRDGSRAAIEVEHRLLPREIRKFNGLRVQPLGLRAVDLIK